MSRYNSFRKHRHMTETISWFQHICLFLYIFVSNWLSTGIHEPSRLESVPLEIFHLILVNLDDADKACLSLCNRALNNMLQASLRRLYNQRSSTRVNFFQRFSRDHSQYFACYTCSGLHSIDKLGPPCVQGDAQPRCIQDSEDRRQQRRLRFAIGDTYPDFELRFEHVQLVMLRHRCGPAYGIALDMLSWAEVRYSDAHGQITLLTVEPKIIAQGLYLRVRHWHIIRSDIARQVFHGPLETLAQNVPNLCHHFNQKASLQWLVDWCECRRCHDHRDADCKMCRSRFQCPICLTEFSIDIKDYGESGTAIIVTKWLSLGRGTSPMDWEWRRHFTHQRPHPMESDHPIEKENPRALFSQHENRTKRQLLLNNDARMLCKGLWLDTFWRRRTTNHFFGDYSNSDVWIRHRSFTKPMC